jgi:hypothetical protein
MEKRIVAIATSVFLLLGAATSAIAQSTTTQQSGQQQPSTTQGSPGMMGPGMMRGGMMGSGMMGGGMMRHHAMAAPLMRIIFALMDSDGDGTISLQEFQAAHERIFKSMDANKDGVLTLDEMQSFMSGQSRSGPQQ